MKDKPINIDGRVKILIVGRQTMLDVLRNKTVLDLDLPEDTAVVEVEYHFASRGFALLLWSYAFEPVEEGREIPRLPPFEVRRNDE